ncbi:hypothetical protein DFH29DRAFT_1005385 [Suillus ampliporus]|nr:hypothetical protein DFH29DRAFT_1005385 [Suillus ampliporus]
MYSDESEEGDDNINEEPTDKVTDGPHDHEDASQDNVMDQQDSDSAASHHAPAQPQIPQPGPSSEVSREAPHQPCLADSRSHDPHNPPQSLSKESIQNPPEPVQSMTLPKASPMRAFRTLLSLSSIHLVYLSHTISQSNCTLSPASCPASLSFTQEAGMSPLNVGTTPVTFVTTFTVLATPFSITIVITCVIHLLGTVMQSMHVTPSIAEVVILKTIFTLRTSMIHASESVIILIQYIPVTIAPFPITCMLMKSKNVSGSLTTTTMWEGQGGIWIGKDHGGDTKTHTTTA